MLSKIKATVALWSTATKVMVSVGATAAVLALGGGATYMILNEDPIVVEESADASADAVLDLSGDASGDLVEEPAEIVTEVIEVPDYQSVYITGESLVKDLTMYILDENWKKITGHEFSVAVLTKEQLNALNSYTSAINEINKQIDAIKDDEEAPQEPVEETTVTDSEEPVQISSVTGKEITEKELLLIQKSELMAEYRSALLDLNAKVYTDQNADGVIYISEIEGGEYYAALVPNEIYIPAAYGSKMTVKAELEYKALENIEMKAEEYEEAGDQQPEEKPVEVEAELVDTVQTVASTKTETSTSFTQVTNSSNIPQAVVSNDMNYIDLNVFTVVTTSATGNATAPTTAPNIVGKTEAEAKTLIEGAKFTWGTVTPQPSASVEAGKVISQSTADDGKTVNVVISTGPETPSVTLGISKSATIYSSSNTSINTVNLKLETGGLSNLTVSCDNANVTATISGNSVVATAKTGLSADTTAKITVSGDVIVGTDKRRYSVTSTVTVKNGTTKIVDADGKQLYTDKTGTEATYGNYTDTLYTKDETYKYTGWQLIDGQQYYYDANGNKVTGEQVISGTKYTFGANGALQKSGNGIDVSKWQGTIDWKQASGAISFAIVRCGFRGSSGGIAEDPKVDYNVKNAAANGVKVGLYFYSIAMNEAQAVEEASLAVAVAKRTGNISLPIYIDMEDSRQYALSKAERDAIVKAFCTTVQNAGYRAGVYANKNWLTNYLTPSSYGSNISIWCAQYNTSCTYSGRYNMWQYSDKGSVPGISGNVDMNIMY